MIKKKSEGSNDVAIALKETPKPTDGERTLEYVPGVDKKNLPICLINTAQHQDIIDFDWCHNSWTSILGLQAPTPNAAQ